MSISEESYLSSLQDLKGKIAIVTGGAAGIGLQTTIYLAQKGCTVYVASRNREKSLNGIARAQAQLSDNAGPISFHHLDLASIESSVESAHAFLKLSKRLDILICNAGAWRGGFSEEGYENTFQTNHLGHFAFVLRLLGLLESTAKVQGDARVVVTTTQGYKVAAKPDYAALKKSDAPSGLLERLFSFRRYMNSKLHNVYFATELDARLRDRGVNNIYVNSCHPGTAGATDFGSDAFGDSFPARAFKGTIKFFARTFGNTVEDAAKTQVWLAASEKVPSNGVHGQYWEPVWSWGNYYRGCRQVEATALARNEEERKRSWDFTVQALRGVGVEVEGWV